MFFDAWSSVWCGQNANFQNIVINSEHILLQHIYSNVNYFIGIDSRTIKLPDTITEDELISKIEELNENSSVDGILVQLPVPAHISERTVCNVVDPKKDVDGFHITNMGKLSINMDTFIPCTALGVIELIKRYLTHYKKCKKLTV